MTDKPSTGEPGVTQGLADMLDARADSYSDGTLSHGPMITAQVAAASALHFAAEMVRRAERGSLIPALVEGLHAQMFGVHSLGDPGLSHAAIADGGQLHEGAHALIRALPSHRLNADTCASHTGDDGLRMRISAAIDQMRAGMLHSKKIDLVLAALTPPSDQRGEG